MPRMPRTQVDHARYTARLHNPRSSDPFCLKETPLDDLLVGKQVLRNRTSSLTDAAQDGPRVPKLDVASETSSCSGYKYINTMARTDSGQGIIESDKYTVKRSFFKSILTRAMRNPPEDQRLGHNHWGSTISDGKEVNSEVCKYICTYLTPSGDTATRQQVRYKVPTDIADKLAESAKLGSKEPVAGTRLDWTLPGGDLAAQTTLRHMKRPKGIYRGRKGSGVPPT